MSEHFICMAALNVYYYLFQHDTIDLYLFTIYFVTSKVRFNKFHKMYYRHQ